MLRVRKVTCVSLVDFEDFYDHADTSLLQTLFYRETTQRINQYPLVCADVQVRALIWLAHEVVCERHGLFFSPLIHFGKRVFFTLVFPTVFFVVVLFKKRLPDHVFLCTVH